MNLIQNLRTIHTILWQCDGVDGVCPDKRIGGSNDVQLLHGARKNGVTTVTFRRPMRAKDVWEYAIALKYFVCHYIAI